MTNVMAWLAARSVSSTHTAAADDGTAMPPVRPRLPHRYEADGAQAPALDIERDDDHGEAARPAISRAVVDHEAGREPLHAQPAARRTQPAEAMEQPRLLRLEPEVRPDRAPPTRLDKTATPEPSPVTERPKDVLASGTSSVHRDAVPAASEVIEAPAPDPRGQPEPRPAAAHDQAEQLPQLRDRAAPGSVVPSQLVRPVTPPALPSTPVRSVVRVVPASRREPLQPLRAAMPVREPSAALAAAPPRVQVTIGRLEIRAATAQPEPPRRQTRPTPAMSLDDYLTDRGKG